MKNQLSLGRFGQQSIRYKDYDRWKLQTFTFTFKFRAFSRRFYPKRLTISTFVIRSETFTTRVETKKETKVRE